MTEVDLRRLEQAVADYLEAAEFPPGPYDNRNNRMAKVSHGRRRLRESKGAEPAADKTAVLEHLRILHWRIDAEVLRLYDLPAALERKVLDLFSGVHRRGVPF